MVFTPFSKIIRLDNHQFLFSPFSEWVIGNREDLAKDIIAEIQPESGEVMYFKRLQSSIYKVPSC